MKKEANLLKISKNKFIQIHTVSDDVVDKTIVKINNDTYKGNTIISEYYKMHMLSGGDKWGMTTEGVITDAVTLLGERIYKDGRNSNGGLRWLFHSMGSTGDSAGCQGATSDFGIGKGNWKNTAVNGVGEFEGQYSGAYRMKILWGTLKDEYNIYDGYEFSVHMGGHRLP